MHGKAAASPRSGATGASENAASVCTCGVPAETWSSAERFREVPTGGTGHTQRDLVNGTLGRLTGRRRPLSRERRDLRGD